ncbi:MAG TPA: glycosyltransferase family 9 protein [Chitinophagaceae bacterium]|nr:glycosyltransferase family 9 protein [Chitinophagaceae bacterium]
MKVDKIILSWTDSIGDVMLTLPLAGLLKKRFPGASILFLGKEYTRPVIQACRHIDEFISVDEFDKEDARFREEGTVVIHVFPVKSIAYMAKRLHIPSRIGTRNRIYHWFTCNRLVRLSRRHSELHEAQLNIKLAAPLGIPVDLSLAEIVTLYGFENFQPLQPAFRDIIDKEKYNLILHPKSQGHAREWGIKNFATLADMLDPGRYKIFISGTENEKQAMQPLIDELGSRVVDITGLMPLDQFISFIHACDGIVANSTGPLHIASAMGKDAIGIYPPMRPVHPGRWGPVGKKAIAFVAKKNCTDCRNKPLSCHCITEILPQTVKDELDARSTKYEVRSTI